MRRDRPSLSAAACRFCCLAPRSASPRAASRAARSAAVRSRSCCMAERRSANPATPPPSAAACDAGTTGAGACRGTWPAAAVGPAARGLGSCTSSAGRNSGLVMDSSLSERAGLADRPRCATANTRAEDKDGFGACLCFTCSCRSAMDGWLATESAGTSDQQPHAHNQQPTHPPVLPARPL